MATLIRANHTQVLDYGYDFFLVCVKELDESKKNMVIDLAYATRVAGASNEDWKKFVGENTPKTKERVKKSTSKEDHARNIAVAKGVK